MYRAFYHLSEKPFTLLPDPGFLYMSEKHRMAFTLLEYGLMSQAGFTVISGDIGAGKTTLIRHLLDNMDQDHTIGLISNTHNSFGELLQWILLAFNLDHTGKNKVDMYQRFVDFIIDEYAHNRRTVLIVDEAQNMSAETLEELRMLSNINADKDQALQVVLVGQNELRDTLRRPDLVQFAQRISVDYHLQPLPENETANYIRHRLKVAGGRPDIFTDLACQAVHRYTNGVPRLINLLCDNALVYGYAEQKQHIDARLVTQVAKEKQQGGIFPMFEQAMDDDFPAEEPEVVEAAEVEAVQTTETPITATYASKDVAPETSKAPKNEGELYWEEHAAKIPVKKKVRLAVCNEKEALRQDLSRLLESYGFDITTTVGLDFESLNSLDTLKFDVLLVDWTGQGKPLQTEAAELLANWDGPVLYNDADETGISEQDGNQYIGPSLADRIHSLAEAAQDGNWVKRKVH